MCGMALVALVSPLRNLGNRAVCLILVFGTWSCRMVGFFRFCRIHHVSRAK
jgi:hypothetical protein